MTAKITQPSLKELCQLSLHLSTQMEVSLFLTDWVILHELHTISDVHAIAFLEDSLLARGLVKAYGCYTIEGENKAWELRFKESPALVLGKGLDLPWLDFFSLHQIPVDYETIAKIHKEVLGAFT
jgi:hypothetical protein